MKKFILFCICMLIAVPVFAGGNGAVGTIDMDASYGIQNYDVVKNAQGQRLSADASVTKSQNWDITSANCGNFYRGSNECSLAGVLNIDKSNYQATSNFHGTDGVAKMGMVGTTCGEGVDVSGTQKLNMGSNFNYSGGSGFANYNGCQSVKMK